MQSTKVTEVYGLNPEELIQKIVLALGEKYTHSYLLGTIREKEETTLLTRNETAIFLNVSLATLNNWANIGIIKKHKIGNLVRYKKAELEEALTTKIKRG